MNPVVSHPPPSLARSGDACRQLLLDGVRELGLALSDNNVAALLAFLGLLEKWNKAYNLTAIRKRTDMVPLHLLDSLAVLPYLHGGRILDVGTGAGLPGIPLAICAPDKQFVLLDSNLKKTRFVRQAVLELKLHNVEVQQARVETYRPQQGFDSVLARAFAALPEIVQLTRHLYAQHGILLAMKGQRPEDELRGLAVPITLHDLQVPGVAGQRCLVRVGPLPASG